MVGLVTGRRGACLLAGLVVLWGSADRAEAVDAFDKRLEAHGFVEIQVRGLDRSYAEEFDLTQWYNVLNLEVEADFLPDGWGPFDLLQAYVRAEGRYDCIYSNACGMSPNVNTYGNESRALPMRLRDGKDYDYAGVIDTSQQANPKGVVLLVNPGKRDPISWSVSSVVETERETQLVPGYPVINRQDTQKFTTPMRYPDGSPLECPPLEQAGATGIRSDNLGSNATTGCVDNRPNHTEITDREGFPGFDTLFNGEGADGELGAYQDYAAMNSILVNQGKMFEGRQVLFYDQSIKDPDFQIPAPTPGSGAHNDNQYYLKYAQLFRGLADERDDPAFYTLQNVIDWKFTFTDHTGAVPSGKTLPMGPWLPENFFGTTATLGDVANPLRDRRTPTLLVVNDKFVRPEGTRLTAFDCGPGGPDAGSAACAKGFDPVDPRLETLETLSVVLGAAGVSLYDPGLDGGDGALLNLSGYPNNSLFNGVLGDKLFGGDYSGIIPCYDTSKAIGNRKFPIVATPDLFDSKFIKQLTSVGAGSGGKFARSGCIPLTNVRVTGGEGELPMRVAPDFSNLSPGDLSRAQGIYYPSWGLRDYVEAGGDFDDHEFNISETDRAWNRGASQRETYELKEAYLDMEFLESRLWIRAGIQNIVWGKTELFRTTDQFNPQDFALASLPNLEESRIALLSWRGVYSFYDVGPLEDVRFEFAMNFDRNKPVDLGACGEPYTLDVVCGLTFGTAIHGVTGLGVAGFDRPPAGWEDVDGLEFGGRLEFRWDRFSFAIVDFYGYSDFPYPDVLTFFERNVDAVTGMPRKGGATGSCANRAGFVATEVFAGGGGTGAAGATLLHGGNYAEQLANPGVAAVEPVGYRDVIATGEVAFNNPAAANDDYWRRKEAYTVMGIGTDPACLKPGGAPGGQNENRFNPALAPSLADFLAVPGNTISDYSNAGNLPGERDEFKLGTYIALTLNNDPSGDTVQWSLPDSSVDYALLHHPANQQLFNFICSGTVSIAVALAPAACAWNLWGTDARLAGDLALAAFGDTLSGAFAGNKSGGYEGFYDAVINNTKGVPLGLPVQSFPVAPLNSDAGDGRTTSVDSLVGTGLNFVGAFFSQVRKKDTARDFLDLLTLDNTLTSWQKATLGCGPFLGTRCDTGVATVRVRIKDCSGKPAGSPNQVICDTYKPLADLDEGGGEGALDIEGARDALAVPELFTIVKSDGLTPCIDPFAPPGTPVNIDECLVWGRGGGIDFLNMEASVILQSMPGFEGTEGRTNMTDPAFTGWVTWAENTAQPGTVGVTGREGEVRAEGFFGPVVLDPRDADPFVGGTVCTRYAPNDPLADASGLVKLPGCRGALSAIVDGGAAADPFDNVIKVEFDVGYTPRVDGCVFARSMEQRAFQSVAAQTFYVVAHTRVDGELEYDADLQDELYKTCFNSNQAMIPGTPVGAGPPGTETRTNAHYGDSTWFSYSKGLHRAGARGTGEPILKFGAETLFHPTAQCQQAGPPIAGTPSVQGPVWNPEPGFGGDLVKQVNNSKALCQSLFRDFENDFILGNASVFRNELAAVSWNFAMFLVVSSCNKVSGGDDLDDLDCFNPEKPWKVGGCSFTAPQYCRNLKGFLGVGGLGRNDPRAGGNNAFGRRDFIWSSGAELVLKYAQRNVFGFSADFAEDNTKTNWGVEFTWIAATPWVDNNSLNATSKSDAFNLTISVDRPSFINFLNANRTFFFNSQWFFNYIPEHTKGFTTFGSPFNVLFTFAVFTGYYQDRLLPQLVTVYDFGSQSGGFLPQLGYRFTEAFSVTFGVSFFIGKGEYVPMPVRGFAPRVNRGAGPHKYEDGVNRLLANFMRRDEAWMRLRWTF